MGGGTLDVTLMEVDAEEIRILLSEGARYLGGNNFDDILLEMYTEQFREATGTALYSDEYGTPPRPAERRGREEDALETQDRRRHHRQ